MENKLYGTFKTNYKLKVEGNDNFKKVLLDTGKVSFPVTTGNKTLDLSLVNYLCDSKSKYDLTIVAKNIVTKDNKSFDMYLLWLELTTPSTTLFVDLAVLSEDNTTKFIFKEFVRSECVEENLLHEGK